MGHQCDVRFFVQRDQNGGAAVYPGTWDGCERGGAAAGAGGGAAGDPAMRPAEALRELPEVFDAQTLDLIASFQHAVVGNLMRQTFAAAEALGARGIVVSGGVSANSELRRRFAEEAARRGLPVAFPTMAMSTDNAAMIAAAAWGSFARGSLPRRGWWLRRS